MSQKVLVISQTIYPRLVPRAHRATELAKELARQGCDVTLLAALGGYDYTDFMRTTGITVKDLGYSSFEWRTSAGNKNIALWRKAVIFVLRKWFYFPEVLFTRRVCKYMNYNVDFDRIITIAIPYSIHWGMGRARRRNPKLQDVVWISDCGDPFMGNGHGGPPFYFKWVEKRWCRSTDYITVPTELAINGYYPEFRNKIRIIPQGFVFDDSILAQYEKNNVPTFAYSGMVYPQKRDPRRFLDFLVKRKGDFKFVVYTNKPDIFKPYLEKLGDKIEMRDYVPHDQLIHELSKMDFVINIRNESTVQVPSKLIDYYLTHRPILEITSAFNERDTFEEFCHEDYHGQTVIENPERFDIRNVARAFAEL